MVVVVLASCLFDGFVSRPSSGIDSISKTTQVGGGLGCGSLGKFLYGAAIGSYTVAGLPFGWPRAPLGAWGLPSPPP